MNFLDALDNNIFLQRLFPAGLTENVYLGQIQFDVEGRFSINIHTRQKPAMEIDKWGAWGSAYNVIVIKISGVGCRNVNLRNWMEGKYSRLDFLVNDEKYAIVQNEEDWSIYLEYDHLLFQKCAVYMDSEDS